MNRLICSRCPPKPCPAYCFITLLYKLSTQCKILINIPSHICCNLPCLSFIQSTISVFGGLYASYYSFSVHPVHQYVFISYPSPVQYHYTYSFCPQNINLFHKKLRPYFSFGGHRESERWTECR